MKSKEPGNNSSALSFCGRGNGKMRLSIFLAVLGELFGMGPFLMVAVLADALYRGLQRPRWYCFLCGGSAVCQIAKNAAYLAVFPDVHKISLYHTEKYPGGHYGPDGEGPHGLMLETPTGAFKNLIVDNVAKLEGLHGPFHAGTAIQHRRTPVQYSSNFPAGLADGAGRTGDNSTGTLFFAMMRGYGPRMGGGTICALPMR